MQRDHNYQPLLVETLGHAAAATALIAQSLKFDGSVTMQIQGSGDLQMLVMQCTSELEMRGMGAMEQGATASNFAELTTNAHCAITVDAGDQPYQGIVAIDGDSLSSSLEHYFERSVQVPSHRCFGGERTGFRWRAVAEDARSSNCCGRLEQAALSD